MLLMSTWGTRKKASILKGKANWNSIGKSALRQRNIILRNESTISAHAHSANTGAENLLIIPCTVMGMGEGGWCLFFKHSSHKFSYLFYRMMV